MTELSENRAPVFDADDDPSVGYNRLWINLLRIQRTTTARIARKLRAQGIGDPIWMEILVQLDRAGAAGIAMADIERQLHCPQYSLSRHVSRMEDLGMVRGAATAGPGRSKRLVLTEEGRARKAALEPVFAEIVRTEFAPRLSTDDAYDLVRYLIRLYP